MANSNSTRRRSDFIDITGQKFGRWTVLEFHSVAKGGAKRWLCRCECGTVKPVQASSLKRGESRSCKKCAHTKHGYRGTPEYYVWAAMIARCSNPKVSNYHRYGGRGVSVCDRWMTFENFLEDMGLRPSPRHSIDRYPNNDGDYEKSNCRWTTRIQQNRNRRNNHQITFRGKTMCVAEWAEKMGIDRSVLSSRLSRGWSVERTLTAPVKPHKR